MDELGSRTAARIYAAMNNYFWLPCPLCGQYFSGHEWKLNHYLGIPSVSALQPGEIPHLFRGVCPRSHCVEVAKVIHDAAYSSDARIQDQRGHDEIRTARPEVRD